MSATVGVELLAHSVRAVRRNGATIEVAWDPRHPAEALAALAAWTPRPGSIAIAVGASFLEVKRVQLPPSSPAMQARMIALAPDRHFAARVALATSFVPGAGLAIAAERDRLTTWLDAFSAWGEVGRIQAAPMALARVSPDGAFVLETQDETCAVATVADRTLAGFRRSVRLPDESSAATAVDAFAVARAALSPGDLQSYELLAPLEWTTSWSGRQRRRLVTGLAAVLAGLAVLGWGGDQWRERTLVALEREASALQARAEPVAEASARLRARVAEVDALRDIAAGRPDPFAALAALSLALPDDAVVRAARVDANEWQVDGTVADASTVVPALDRDSRFDNVRVLSASSQFREGNRTVETFSIAFRYHAQP